MKPVEFISKAPNVSFENVHPGPQAGRKFEGKDLPSYAGSSGKESRFIRCKQCGFPFDPSQHPPGSGWGNDETEAITTDAGGTANARDPISTAGCPFCSSSDYE